jgi:hypothetical protein
MVFGEHAPVKARFLGQASLKLEVRDDLGRREVERVDP